MKYDMKESGARIRLLRTQSKYTQENLADILNIDRSLLSHIESGKKGCSIDLLVQFSELFRVSLDYLVLGIVHIDSTKTDGREQLRKEIGTMIDHLEMFRKALIQECDKSSRDVTNAL